VRERGREGGQLRLWRETQPVGSVLGHAPPESRPKREGRPCLDPVVSCPERTGGQGTGSLGAVVSQPDRLVYPPAISSRPETGAYQGLFGELEIAVGGTLTRLRCAQSRGRVTTYVCRGKIHEFSAKSRQRLQDLFSSLNRKLLPKRPRFITLTYPCYWDQDPVTWKAHLKAFLQSLKRKYGTFALFWRLEFQEREAPHFHILAFTAQFLDYRWVASTWNRIVAPGDERSLQAGTEVRAIRSWRGIHSYVSKYMAKTGGDAELPEGVGRLWGVWHRHLLPIAVPTFTCTFEEFLDIKRAINGKRAALGLETKSYSKYQGTRIYQPESEGRKLIGLIDPESLFPARALPDSTMPEPGTMSEEWERHIRPFWQRRARLKRKMAEILADIAAHEESSRDAGIRKLPLRVRREFAARE
jgi:hypothetical protein